MSELTLTE